MSEVIFQHRLLAQFDVIEARLAVLAHEVHETHCLEPLVKSFAVMLPLLTGPQQPISRGGQIQRIAGNKSKFELIDH